MTDNGLDVTDDTPDSSQTDEEIIADARDYLELCSLADGDNFKEGLVDLQYLAGNHWPEKQKRQRELDGRPCLTVNKLPTFLNQVTNEQRQNRASIKVNPVGSGADIQTAEVIQGMIKHIEYDSNAEVATDTAVNAAAAIGFGYFRVMPEYCDEKSFYQDLKYKRIRNPFTVAFDPGSTEPDGSDQQRCLIHVKMDRKLFKQEYPEASATSDSLAINGATGFTVNWLAQDYIRVAEFYRIEREPAELVMLSDGGVFWRDEMPSAELLKAAGVTEVNKRRSFKKKVMWYKLTAHEILERTEIMCNWIPVFPVYGSELDIDGKVIRSGLIRNARDPQLMYDFWMTSATEEVAMRPKTPFIGAEGQFEGHENEWMQANVRSFAYLQYKPTTVDGQLAPPPQRQAMADIPSGMLTMAMHANDNIKATTGLFDSSLGAAGNATSGKQELAQQRQGNIANFHYQDGLTRTLRHVGRCLINMFPHYYDTERVVKIMRDDGEVVPVTINKRLSPEEAQQLQQEEQAKSEGKYSAAIKSVLNDITVGQYGVVVDTGPSYTTMRQQASDAMVQFGQSWPKLMDIAGDKVVKAMDWPGAQEIAQRIERTIPPEIRYDPKDPKAGPPPLPPEVKQQLGQMNQMIQGLQQENQRLKTGIDKEQIKAESNEQIAQIKGMFDQKVAEIGADAKKDVEEIKGWIEFMLLKLTPPPALEGAAVEDLTEENRTSPDPGEENTLNGQSLPTGE